MSTYVASPLKICIFRNGDRNYFGKSLVVPRRPVKDKDREWDQFLDRITGQVGLSQAARSLCTPVGGTEVKSIEDLEHSKKYVAVGSGKFKKLPYDNLEAEHKHWLQQCHNRRQQNAKRREHALPEVDGKPPPPTLAVPVVIQVYCNGKEYEPARRVVLTRRMMDRQLRDIYSEISQHINSDFGVVTKLYTVEGQRVHETSELVSNGQYVAVGQYGGYQRLNYGMTKPAFSVTSHFHPHRVVEKPPARLAPITETNDHDHTAGKPSASEPDLYKPKPRKRTRRAQERYVRADGSPVWRRKPGNAHRSPVRHVDYDKDEGGVFKAASGRDETRDAQEVNDTEDTQRDIPLDLQEPATVEEEAALRPSYSDDYASPTESGKRHRPQPPPDADSDDDLQGDDVVASDDVMDSDVIKPELRDEQRDDNDDVTDPESRDDGGDNVMTGEPSPRDHDEQTADEGGSDVIYKSRDEDDDVTADNTAATDDGGDDVTGSRDDDAIVDTQTDSQAETAKDNE